MSLVHYIALPLLVSLALTSGHGQKVEPQVMRVQNGVLYCTNGDSLELDKNLKNNSQLIFLLFHAEQDTIGMDPGLSIQGRYRALHLLKLFKDLDVKAFYSTPFRNNVLTLQPLMDSKRKEIIYYDQADIAALVQKIDHIYPATVMVVVHPQTIHKILSQLSGKDIPYKADGNLSEKLIYLDRNKKNGSYNLKHLRYPIR